MNNSKYNTSTLEGQKQLIDLGKTLENTRELEEIRNQKEIDLDEYLNVIKIKIPEGSKKDNYTNTIRNMIYENKDFLNRYIKNEFSKSYDEDLLLNDIINLYCGYRISKMRKKKLKNELERNKIEIKDMKETYEDLSKECIENEEQVDMLAEKVIFFRLATLHLCGALIVSNVILMTYVFLGPERLVDDGTYLINGIGNILLLIIESINIGLNYLFHLNNLLKLGIASSMLIAKYTYEKYKDKISLDEVNKFSKRFFKKYILRKE